MSLFLELVEYYFLNTKYFWFTRISCSSLKGHYICIVAVQHCCSSKIDLSILSKLATVEKISFYKLPLYFCNTIVNSIISTTTGYLVLPNISWILQPLLRIQEKYAPPRTNVTWPSTGSLFKLNSYSISHSSKHIRCSAFQETFELHVGLCAGWQTTLIS